MKKNKADNNKQRRHKLSSSKNSSNVDNKSIPYNVVYKPIENTHSIKDLDVEPCFEIDKLVNCFIQQIDNISEMNTENTPMIGIFAPWGRGKSYFLKLVCEKLKNDRGTCFIKRIFSALTRKKRNFPYLCISFNAWKYQDTPAIWAHLFKKMHEQACWGRKIIYWFRSTKCNIELIIPFALTIIFYLSKFFTTHNTFVNYFNPAFKLSFLSTVIVFLINNRKQVQKVFSIVDKYSKNISYDKYLGIQHEIESSLVKLIKTLAIGKKRVILCVEDIDRCPQDTMIKILDSLRTILENEKVRDKLIIICCADIKKIQLAYTSYKKRKVSYSEIREQLDKWFIFSLGLARLGKNHIKEYLSKILTLESSDAIPIPSLVDDTRERGSLTVHPLGQTDMALTDNEIYELIANYIGNMTPEKLPTPRKVRILCYQIFFARTLGSIVGIRYPENFFESLIHKSLTGRKNYQIDEVFGDVIDMVVPY